MVKFRQELVRRDWSKSIEGLAGAESRWVISFSALGKGWAVNFLLHMRVRHVFLTGISTRLIGLTQSTTTGGSLYFQKRKRFEPWLKKYPWLVYSKDGNFIYCKI